MQGLMQRKLPSLRTALSISELHSEDYLLYESNISAAADHLPADPTPGTSGLSRLANMAGKAFLGMTDLLNTAHITGRRDRLSAAHNSTHGPYHPRLVPMTDN